KIQQIGIIKRTVFESLQLLQIAFLMVLHEIERHTIHPVDEFNAFVNNCFPLAPSQYGREKTHDLDILLTGEPMRNAYRIVVDKRPAIIFVYLPIKKALDVK